MSYEDIWYEGVVGRERKNVGACKITMLFLRNSKMRLVGRKGEGGEKTRSELQQGRSLAGVSFSRVRTLAFALSAVGGPWRAAGKQANTATCGFLNLPRRLSSVLPPGTLPTL